VKRRLFWKLLIGSWITLALVAVGNGILFYATAHQMLPVSEGIASRYAQLELAAAVEILQSRGPAALDAFLGRLPPYAHLDIDREAHPGPQASPLEVSRSQLVSIPSGDVTLTVRAPILIPNTPPLLWQVPAHLLVVDFLALSLFSLVIAQYLAGPIRRLSTGMARAADGDLNVRVATQLGGRRDEMADLARSFDYMADRLQQLLQARERLLHDVSHEFRSPLTRIRLAAEIARQNPERCASSLDRIASDTERLGHMVNELLTLSRAQFAQPKSETYFDLADLLADVVSDVRFEAEAANIKLDVVIPEHLRGRTDLILNGNSDLLRKAIENVLRNAVRFSRSGQSVTLSLNSPAAAPGMLQIEISDQGPGVPSAALERIFEPFERLAQSSSSGGFGLGLAIARTAVRAHHGTIWAANRLGGGLIVTLQLPLERNTSPLEGPGLRTSS
jgi:two-component system OmpR family sensor kinase